MLAADETLGNIHGDAADRILAEMLRDLENEPVAVVRRLERIEDLRQMRFEFDVDDSADHLSDMAYGLVLSGISHGLCPL